MQRRAEILVIASDAQLLETRRWVLERAGWRVHSVGTVDEARQVLESRPIEVTIYCHSLSDEDRREALALAQGLRPGMRNLFLTANLKWTELGPEDDIFDIAEGPEALVGTVRGMLQAGERGRTCRTEPV